MKIIALILMGFIIVTAMLSGLVLAIYPDGSIFQMSVSILETTSFTDFLIPGLILCLVVGGSSLTGTVALIFEKSWAHLAIFFAGLILSGWIVVQYLLIKTFDWLQIVFISIGMLLLLLSIRIRYSAV